MRRLRRPRHGSDLRVRREGHAGDGGGRCRRHLRAQHRAGRVAGADRAASRSSPPENEERSMKTYRIATIPGDGIGKEVVPAGRSGAGGARRGQAGFAFAFDGLRLGRRLVPRARRDDAGRRPRCAAREGRDPVRLGRRSRHSGPRDALGPAPRDLPGLRPVRQRAADAHPAGHRRAAEALHAARTSTG